MTFCGSSSAWIDPRDGGRAPPAGPARRPRRTRWEVGDAGLLAPGVMRVLLRPVNGDMLHYHAGQYLKVCIRPRLELPLSIANAPGTGRQIELHLRLGRSGPATDWLHQAVDARGALEIKAPYGRCVLDARSDRPLVLVATGVGIAQSKALLEQALALDRHREVHLYWGVSRATDLYLERTIEGWRCEHPHLGYTPVVSRRDAGQGWRGRVGYVQDALLEEHPELLPGEYYLSGCPSMVRDTAERLLGHGVPAERIRSDAWGPGRGAARGRRP